MLKYEVVRDYVVLVENKIEMYCWDTMWEEKVVSIRGGEGGSD